VGKTRLALEVAARVVAEHPDGAWLFELAPHDDDAAVVGAVATAFAVHGNDPSLADLREAIVSHLASRHVLLLLDNCEHVVDPVATLVHTLLSHCPHAKVLATSRELLRVPGERAFAVPPLSLPPTGVIDLLETSGGDALALFCERARESRPEFALTSNNCVDVVRICRRLDGIPLAIELAAARTRMLTVNQIAEGLEQSFSVLGHGPRTAVARQQTLRAAMDWSYDLLAAAEQAALRGLAVFPDRFLLDAALAVIGSSPEGGEVDAEAVELVSRLVDKSLVEAASSSQHVRYRLLEPVRQYAEEKLAQTGELDLVRRRHRDFFLGDSARWRTQVNKGLRILADHTDLRAALEWSWEQGDVDAALALVVVHSERLGDRQLETRGWLERVLGAWDEGRRARGADPTDADHPAVAQALALLALNLQESGMPGLERPAHLMLDATEMAERIGDDELSAWVNFLASELNLALGRSAEARRLLESALATYERRGSAVNAGWCHVHLGWAAVADSGPGRARRHFEQAAQLAKGDDEGGWLAGHALAALAPITALTGDPERGLALAEEVLAAARNVPVPDYRVMSLVRAAETAILAGSHDRAAEVISEVLECVRESASQRWVADALEMAALVLEDRHDADVAVTVLRAAAALRATYSERRGGTRALADDVREVYERLIDRAPDEGRDPQGASTGAAVTLALTALQAAAVGR
jgi:predicted ATPase